MSIAIYFSNSENYSFLSEYGINQKLGNKGLNLFKMKLIEVPVPDFFTISSEICINYIKNNEFEYGFAEKLESAIERLKQNHDSELPFVVSIRSGSVVSMPGMMDTILNVGLTKEIVDSFAGTEWYLFYLKNYYKLICGYSKTVLKLDVDVHLEPEKEEDILRKISEIKELIASQDLSFPENIYEQVYSSIIAVAKSWMSQRAVAYRKIHNIDDEAGTSVTVQRMVFGNLNGATGVIFTRNPSDGKKELYGEYILNAQGEDIVSGAKTPKKIDKENLHHDFPEAYIELKNTCEKLEKHYRDIQDIEFTIENGKLYILQTRSAKRTIESAIISSIEMLDEGLISEAECLLKINPYLISQLFHKSIDYSKNPKVVGLGLPASPGSAYGKLVLSVEAAKKFVASGDSVILCRLLTSPEDIEGIHISSGIFTAFGGMTSHAAVVTRGIGKPCVSGVNNLLINEENKSIDIDGTIIMEGDYVAIDGYSGKIISGHVDLVEKNIPKEFNEIVAIAKKFIKISVRTNSDTVADILLSNENKANGVGLCRTEHMMLDPQKLNLFRAWILSNNDIDKNYFIEELKSKFKDDFIEMLKCLDNKSIAIRLLDPPLHEFLPSKDEEINKILNYLETQKTKSKYGIKSIKNCLNNLHEHNPMLGHRGCRLGITNPRIYETQIEAIFESLLEVRKFGINPKIEITIPFIATEMEIKITSQMIHRIAKSLMDISGIKFDYLIGAMVELPRACLIADRIAKYCDYFSFGTNDLTQTTYGISRDDIASFLTIYKENNIFSIDPFVTIDKKGVGKLMKKAIELGKSSNPNLKIGVCGEHGGDPDSIEFFQSLGVDYVSCSPYRIIEANLASAISNIKSNKINIV